MQKFIYFFLLINFTVSSSYVFSQEYEKKETIKKKGFTLVFVNKDSLFNKDTKKKMINAFFTVYPKLVKHFNKDAAKKVRFIIDPDYKGVAATSGGVIRYSPKWMKEHPEDIDVVTHEAMHVVQDYRKGGGPGWLTEGIADYVRYKYGVNNVKGKWTLPEFKETHSYTNSYRITARFLLWLEQHGYKEIVRKLDEASRAHTYKPELWKELTGKTVDDLWKDYSVDPTVDVEYR